MQKKGWNPHFELVTFITREELERRLKNVTILRSKKNFFFKLAYSFELRRLSLCSRKSD